MILLMSSCLFASDYMKKSSLYFVNYLFLSTIPTSIESLRAMHFSDYNDNICFCIFSRLQHYSGWLAYQ